MSGYLYDCCGSILYAHERIEMMIIDFYDKYGDRIGYYGDYSDEPIINIMYGSIAKKY